MAYVYAKKEGMAEQAAETFDQAIQLAEEARALNPRDPYVNSDLALYYAKTNQVQLAVQRIETAMALASEIAEIKATAAEVFELAKDRERAVRYVEEAIELGYPLQRFSLNSWLAELLKDDRLNAGQ